MKIIYKKIILVFISLLIILVAVFLMGPKIKTPEFSEEFPVINTGLTDLEDSIRAREIMSGEVKDGNEAEIIWNDSIPTISEYAIVYLHGFGASHKEGYPVNVNLADSLNANLYLARLAGHGLSEKNAFEGLTAEEYMQSALDALALGQKLGEKVILMGTSTGGAQALHLAAQFPNKVHALVLYSPYIRLKNNSSAELVVGPWGKEITKLTVGGEIAVSERPDSIAAYWSTHYHVDGYYSLFSMIDLSMREETFKAVKAPVFLAYYYKNEAEQDDVVSVAAMNEMFASLGSTHKKKIAFPETGDHVIASSLRSKDWRSVQDSTWSFLENIR